MHEMRNYSGNPIDAAWKTAPWNDKDGETIQKGTTNHNGDIDMTELPKEVNGKRLTKKQEAIIRTAVRNPEYSTAQIDDIVGAGGYAAQTLRKKCPGWYENTFKPTGKSTDHTRDDYREDSDETDDDPAEIDDTEPVPELAPPEAVAHPQSEPNAEQPPEWKTYAVVGLVAFIFGLLWGGRNE